MRHGGQPGWVKMTTFFGMQARRGNLARGCNIFVVGPQLNRFRSPDHPMISISDVIFAVLPSICEIEQYFSLDRRTASSTDLRETLPATR